MTRSFAGAMAVIPREAAGSFERIDGGLADVFALRRSLRLSNSRTRARVSHIAAADAPPAAGVYDQSGMARRRFFRRDPPSGGGSAADLMSCRALSANPLHSGAR